jgi:hypothetical protein
LSDQKAALFVVFKPPVMPTNDELRAQFSTSYPVFRDMEEVEYKCWWISQKEGEWGALYVFRSKQELEAYLSSDRWQKIIPEKYGCNPTWRVMEAGMIISKTIITEAEGSWLN